MDAAIGLFQRIEGHPPMRDVLIAPQFGLVGPAAARLDSAQPGTAEPNPLWPTAAAPGPSVVVKRRRLPALASVDDSAAPAETPRSSKVYRLDRTPLDAPKDSPVPLEAGSPMAEPAPSRTRRRASAVRKPVLVTHQVFEPVRPTALPSEATAPSLATHSMDLRKALKSLDETLGAVARAQEAYRALDELLSSLRVPGQAAKPLK